MRLPIIPIAVAVVLLGAAAALLLTSSPPTTMVMGTPRLSSLVNVPGVETQVSVAPDGMRYLIVASGDLWLVGPDGAAESLTASPERESSPSWSPDGARVTFTRGEDTFAIDLETREETLYLEDAKDLDWSANGGAVFVRGRALWLSEGGDAAPRELVGADTDEDVAMHSPRFSPSGERVIFMRSLLGLRAQVWISGLNGLPPTPLVADRIAENPSSADWVDEQSVVYLTDRSGGLAVWHIDLEENTMVPLTVSLMGQSLAPLGLDVSGERIVVPRHTIDSNIQSGGTVVVEGPQIEFAPAVSARGNRIAYTVVDGDRFEIWVAGSDGTRASYVTRGRHPRFAPNGNEIVYSNTDLDGNRDIWKVDIRTGIPVRLTDDPGFDDTPDWSPDGRTILFASGFGGGIALWSVPSAGGGRLRWNDGGYAPRFSPDGTRVAFWNDGEIWIADADGASPRAVASIPTPAFSAWFGDEVVYTENGRLIGNVDGENLPPRILPEFDRSNDGEWLFAAVETESTELLGIDLTYVEQEQ